MYVPDPFRLDDIAEVHAFLRAHPFAAIVSAGSGGIQATHAPMVFKESSTFGVLEFHLARANPHWKELASGGESLVIVQGAESYITPNWYPSKAEHGKAVPTWNYAIVHAYGTAEKIDDKNWLRQHLAELTAQHEAQTGKPWMLSDAPDDYIEVMMRGVVAFRFVITRFEAKMKMSQNRPITDRQGVVTGLQARGQGHDAEVATLVARNLTPAK